jgi:diguanylate cyclase (GGDEF)-like protein
MLRIGLLSAQRDRAERALEHQATHDPLTHLPNRREFVTRLAEQLGLGRQCAILFLDLDGFKGINDRYGHDTGDRLLTEVAFRLRSCVRAPHTVSRFGGDEFVIMLVDTTVSTEEGIQNCIQSEFSRPFDEAGGMHVGVSIGSSRADGERDPETLIRYADRAMYRVKASRHATR